eukprot:scaffold11500_cov117-Isochrysis_galbana.AAC.3
MDGGTQVSWAATTEHAWRGGGKATAGRLALAARAQAGGGAAMQQEAGRSRPLQDREAFQTVCFLRRARSRRAACAQPARLHLHRAPAAAPSHTGGAANQSPGRLAKAHAAAWADEPPGTPPRLSAGIGCPTAVASAAVGCWQTSRAKKRITAPAAGKASTHCA